jgi:Putative Flp pilus-assembly TadE/G-like
MIKKTNRFRKNGRRRDNGQAALFLMLGLGLFLLGAMGFAVDMANLWMHRQSSQNAADAACTAAAMDMVNDANGATNSGGFTSGTAFNCSSNSTFAPCQYAGFNGYTATGLTAGTPSTEVAVSFPSSVPGVQDCSATPTPTVCTSAGFPANAFARVTVTDRIQSFFVGLFSGGTTMDVGATATCGAVLSDSPIPILVLNPSAPSTFTASGTYNLQIVGGPQRSIQVDSSDSGAVNFNGNSGTIDLHLGGKDQSGSDFAVTASQPQPSGGTYLYGSTGGWRDPRPAISDPFATLPVPPQPADAPTPTLVTGSSATAIGCPAVGCMHYQPGRYTSDINISTNGPAGLAVFDPGIYYMDANLIGGSHSCLRPSTAAGDGSGGTMFYFHGKHTVNVGATSGTLTLTSGSPGVTVFDCQSTANEVTLSQAKCIQSGTGATVLPANLVTAGGLIGNVLLGPCQAPSAGGTNYGDPLGTNDPLGEQRGMLFFQDRSANLASPPTNQPSWSGGGAFGLAGMMYFHNTTLFTDQFSLGGGSASTTFVVGDIVTDKLDLHGTPGIEMDLNPNALYYVLKASLLQ